MSLKSGTLLGPYEIHSLIGVGGMGEVYKAWDTRLDRENSRKPTVAVRGESALDVGAPTALFETRIYRGYEVATTRKHQYDVAADGQHFLVLHRFEYIG